MKKEKSKGTDMLNGPLAGKIIMFALPILLTSVVQQLFNSADTAVIGCFGEKGTLAAVGTNGEIAALIVSLSAGTAVLSSVIFGVILAALGELVSKPLLALINTPDEIFSDALTYLRIYILSVPFLLIYTKNQLKTVQKIEHNLAYMDFAKIFCLQFYWFLVL
ncbi:MATE family efflux transporter [Huintestinicola sp.]